MNESNIILYLRFRELGALDIYFKQNLVILDRPIIVD